MASPGEEESGRPRVTTPTSNTRAWPGPSSNADGRIPKGGLSTRPRLTAALEKSGGRVTVRERPHHAGLGRHASPLRTPLCNLKDPKDALLPRACRKWGSLTWGARSRPPQGPGELLKVSDECYKWQSGRGQPTAGRATGGPPDRCFRHLVAGVRTGPPGRGYPQTRPVQLLPAHTPASIPAPGCELPGPGGSCPLVSGATRGTEPRLRAWQAAEVSEMHLRMCHRFS